MEYVWVAGGSAVGKKTLMQKLQSDGRLRERFGLRGLVRFCGPGFDDHPSKVPAEDLMNLQADYVIIKWQFVSHPEIEKLRILRRDATHRILILRRPADQHLASVTSRNPEWDYTLGRIEQEWNHVLDSFRPLKAEGYPIDVVDASDPSNPTVDGLL